MTLKINRVLENLPDFKKPEWKGTIHKCRADIVVDGAQFTGEVSTFDDGALKDGAEFSDVTVREYNGAKTYSVKSARAGAPSGGGWKGGRQPMEKTNWKDFMRRVDACWLKACGLERDNTERIVEIFTVLVTNSWTVDVATITEGVADIGKKAKEILGKGPDNDTIPF
jgi:hypothetical protein